jgi:type II secretory pathway component PulF
MIFVITCFFPLLLTIAVATASAYDSNASGTTISKKDLAILTNSQLTIADTPILAIEQAFRTISEKHYARSTNTSLQTVRNELIEGKCADIIVIFARGTYEPGKPSYIQTDP